MKNFLGSCLLISLAVLFAPIVGRGATSTPYPGTGYVQIVGNTTAGDMVTVQVDANGVLATSGGGGGGGGTSSNFAAAFPTAGTAAGFKDSAGVNMTFAKVNASNAQLVDGSLVTQPVSGTFWQTTQPVSGTFFQATQPVSITATINANAIQSGTWNIGTVTTLPAVTQGTAAAVTAGWPIINGEFPTDTTGTFTNGTQTNSVTTGGSIDGYATILVTVTGTYGTASAVFEMSDDGGTTWYAASGVRSDSATIENGYTTISNTTRAWFVSVAGTDAFRLRSTAVASGTVNVRFSISAAPVGLQSTTQIAAGANIIGALTANQTVNLAQIASVTTSTGLGAADTGTQRVSIDTDQVITGAAAQTATVNNIIPSASGATSTDVTGFQSGSIQLNSTGTGGSYILEGSNDDTTFVTIPMFNKVLVTGLPITAAVTPSSSTIIYTFPIDFRRIRLRIATTITGGSIAAVTDLRHAAWTPVVTSVASPTAANSAVTASIAAAQTLATVTTVSTLSNTTALTPGVAATNLGKAEDAASASGDTGVATWGVRRDVLTAQANATGDYNEMSVTKYGAHYTFDQEKNLPTYRASTAAGGIALVASATDVAILPGNATNTVYVTKIIISGVETTAGQVLVNVIKRSAANTAGSSAAMTAVPLDSADAAASSAPLSYTGNPTPGATVGIVDSSYVPFAPAATGTSLCTYTFNFGERGKGVKLSGTAQGLAVNMNGVTVTGGNAVVTFEWREEP